MCIIIWVLGVVIVMRFHLWEGEELTAGKNIFGAPIFAR